VLTAIEHVRSAYNRTPKKIATKKERIGPLFPAKNRHFPHFAKYIIT